MRAALTPRGNRPTVVIMRTIKGRGVPGLEGRMESHYLPLTETTYQAALAHLGSPA
jgi:transketolase